MIDEPTRDLCIAILDRMTQGELTEPSADWLRGYHYGFDAAVRMAKQKIGAHGNSALGAMQDSLKAGS